MPVLRFTNPNCSFVRIPKTGSTSIRKGLLRNAKQIQRIESNDQFAPERDDQFSFAFVRDPVSRFQSAVQMFQRYPTRSWKERWQRRCLTIDRVLDIVEDQSIPLFETTFLSKVRLHHIPMTHPTLMLQHARYLADFDNFHNEVEHIASKLGIVSPEIPHLRKNDRKVPSPVLNDVTKERFLKVYRSDLEFYQRFSQSKVAAGDADKQ